MSLNNISLDIPINSNTKVYKLTLSGGNAPYTLVIDFPDDGDWSTTCISSWAVVHNGVQKISEQSGSPNITNTTSIGDSGSSLENVYIIANCESGCTGLDNEIRGFFSYKTGGEVCEDQQFTIPVDCDGSIPAINSCTDLGAELEITTTERANDSGVNCWDGGLVDVKIKVIDTINGGYFSSQRFMFEIYASGYDLIYSRPVTIQVGDTGSPDTYLDSSTSSFGSCAKGNTLFSSFVNHSSIDLNSADIFDNWSSIGNAPPLGESLWEYLFPNNNNFSPCYWSFDNFNYSENTDLISNTPSEFTSDDFEISFTIPKEYLANIHIVLGNDFLFNTSDNTNIVCGWSLGASDGLGSVLGNIQQFCKYNIEKEYNYCGECVPLYTKSIDCNQGVFVNKSLCSQCTNVNIPNNCIPEEIRVDITNMYSNGSVKIYVNGQLTPVAESPLHNTSGCYPSWISEFKNNVLGQQGSCQDYNGPADWWNLHGFTYDPLSGEYYYNTDIGTYEVFSLSGITTYNQFDPLNPNYSTLPDHVQFGPDLPSINSSIGASILDFYGTIASINQVLNDNELQNIIQGHFTSSLIWTNISNTEVTSLKICVEYDQALGKAGCSDVFTSFYVHCPTCTQTDCVLDINVADWSQCEGVNTEFDIALTGVVPGGDPVSISLNGSTIWTENNPTSDNYTVSHTDNLAGNNTITVTQGDCSGEDLFNVTIGAIDIDISSAASVCYGTDIEVNITPYGLPGINYFYFVSPSTSPIEVTSNPIIIPTDSFTPGDEVTIIVGAEDEAGCSDTEIINILVEDCIDPDLTCQGPNDVNMLECTPQSQVENTFTAWLGQFSYTATNCPAVTETWTIDSQSYANVNDIPLIAYCGGSVTVDYQVEGCGISSSCMATFFTPPPVPLNAICPAFITLNNPTQPQLDSEFDTWINSFSYTANCDPIEGYEVTEVYVPTVDGVRGNPTALVDIVPPPITGGVLEVEYEISDPCGQSATCVSIFTVECTPNADVQALIVPPYVYTTDPCNSYIFGLGSGLSGENADGVINAVNNCNCGCTVSSTFRATNTITVWNAITKDTQLHSNTETGQGGGNACGTGAGTNVSPTIDITTIQGKYFEQVLTNPYISGTEGCNLNTLELLGIYDPDNLYTVVASEALLSSAGDVFVDSSNFMIKGYLPSDLTGGATCP